MVSQEVHGSICVLGGARVDENAQVDEKPLYKLLISVASPMDHIMLFCGGTSPPPSTTPTNTQQKLIHL